MRYYRKFLLSCLILGLSTLLSMLFLPTSPLFAQSTDVSLLSQNIQDEAAVVYETNLIRRQEGLAPLRWNAELSSAARWFARHAVEDHPNGYCGHNDLVYGELAKRIQAVGYANGHAWGENVICGYSDPKAAVDAWMQSPGHRENLLNPVYREIGLGYYYRTVDGHGYVVQDLAYDKYYAPVIIENEALTTAKPEVTLYIYNHEGNDGFGGLGPAKEIMISNEPTFASAQWEPFVNEKSWTLEAGEGWRTVYVKTRDALGRSTLVHDTIYLGTELSAGTWNLDEVASRVKNVYGYEDIAAQENVDLTAWSQVQFSSNWMADDSMPSFELLQGNGQVLSDETAVGGQAFRLMADQPLSRAWMWSGNFLPVGQAVAYVRLKVANNQSNATAIKVRVDIDEQTYGPLEIAASDFGNPNQYKEFAIPFNVTPETGLIVLYFERIGDTDVDFDVVTFYSASQQLDSAVNWTHGNMQRSRTLWSRLLKETEFSAGFEVKVDPAVAVDAVVELPSSGSTTPVETIDVTEDLITFSLFQNSEASASTATITCTNCAGSWSVSSNREWLTAEQQGANIDVKVSAAGMEPGEYEGEITVSGDAESALAPKTVNVILNVQETSEVGGGAATITFLPVIKVGR